MKRHGVSWEVKRHGFLGSKKTWISWEMEGGVSWEVKR